MSATDDLVDHLHWLGYPRCDEAAEEILRLRTENGVLRAWLELPTRCGICVKRPAHPFGALCDPCVGWLMRPWWQFWRRRP